MRYIVEGEWSGYTSRQRRVCHRKVTTRPKFLGKLQMIRYTDGTTLELSIRPCKKRERVKEIDGYSSLIEKAVMKDKEFVIVEELN